MQILTWYSPHKNGAIQIVHPLGIYSDYIETKPKFSFDYENFSYIEQSQEFLIDNKPMTQTQKDEVLSALLLITPPIEWIKSNKNMDSIMYLKNTDWYIIRKSETGEAIPIDILSARQSARDYISSVNAGTDTTTSIEEI